MRNYAKILSAAAVCGVMAASVAHADTVVLGEPDRTVVQEYVYQTNNGCPPGAVMKKETRWFGLVHPEHSCVIPKGTNVTVYQPGMAIPSTVSYTPLPATVVSRLPAAPAGDVYVTSDNQIYLINPTTRTVVQSAPLYDIED